MDKPLSQVGERLPSKETRQVFKETDIKENLTEWTSLDTLFSSIKEKASRSKKQDGPTNSDAQHPYG